MVAIDAALMPEVLLCSVLFGIICNGFVLTGIWKVTFSRSIMFYNNKIMNHGIKVGTNIIE